MHKMQSEANIHHATSIKNNNNKKIHKIKAKNKNR